MSSSLTNSWQPAGNPDGKYSVFAQPIVKSPQDDREYRLIKLHNGLQALLVADKTSDKAAASLSVGVGHLSDPDDMPGLAHYCEHLLFMGTKQFPKENDYSEFISANGGRSNAYTATTNTNYHFDVSHTALVPALERFSAFFHSPLFSPSCTERELRAVDSENKKNKQDDTWRAFQLDKFLSLPEVRWHKFGSGNWESLTGTVPKEEMAQVNGNGSASAHTSGNATPDESDGGPVGRETRRRLLEWYEKEYCASKMTLAILGRESLDELTSLAVKHFSPIPTRNEGAVIPSKRGLGRPWGPEQEGTIILAKSVMDFHAIDIRWVVPWSTPHYHTKPANYLSHFLGHEGPGSVHSYLKRKGWILNLSSGGYSADRDSNFEFFRVLMTMTKEGWKHHEEVVESVYAYLNLLRSGPLPEWSQNEIKAIRDISFRFTDKASPDSYVTRLAEHLGEPYAREHVISGPKLIQGWDESLLRTFLDQMTPSKGRISLMAREDWDKITVNGQPVDDSAWAKERWYETEHQVLRPSPDWMRKLESDTRIEALSLCGPNPFIPENLEVEGKKEGIEPLKRPLKIRDTSLSTLWHKKDDRFWVPKAHVVLGFKSPLCFITPSNAVKTRLFCDLVEDSLTETTYDADLAGLSYSISNNDEGFRVVLRGYNDKMPVLLEVILKKIKTLSIDPERFAVLKDQLRQELENDAMNQPYKIADDKVMGFLWERVWTSEEKLAELKQLNAEDVQFFISEMLSRAHIQALAQGNLFKDDAINLVTLAERILGARALTPAERITPRCLLLPEGGNFVYEAPVPNKDNVNSALTYYCQIGDVLDSRLRATSSLLAQIAHEPCFNRLRTKEQLGYIVSSVHWAMTGTMGFRIVVQSERDPVYLESRVDAFLDALKVILEEMDEVEFEKQKQSLIDKKMEKIKNIGEEAGRFWNAIDTGYCDFLRRETDAAILETVTRQEVLEVFSKSIHPSSPSRAKISVHLRSQAAPSPKVSVAAARAFLPHLLSHGVPIVQTEYETGSAAQPPLDAALAHYTSYFASLKTLDQSQVDKLLALLVKLAKLHPVTEEGAEPVRLREGTVFIKDVANFKAQLTLSKAAMPIENYFDLAVSKL
ncbi:hypothetical protein BOTBODRAFT_36079 [Botryobasidium botryosum FD-172 SS1]|uniref:Peptidase M16 N-terminal domain-containing protein n=1 Tax=Botryobasidium botryosum (strain FD-172 SS1) TaxID=930990 RepID=A0A067MF97_BOTB1|nr:hypothetical protein BOTBODRAFT_36079 [Botryobasidium botryosum FD-172 SS1]